MDLGLRGRVAVVTGGSRGLGRAEAEALAAEGATVVIAARNVHDAEEVAHSLAARGGQALAVQADVSRTADVQRLVQVTVETFERLDILVNNAGTVDSTMAHPLLDMPEEVWDVMLANHVRSTFLCIKHAAPHMVRRGWGRIVNTASVHGRVGGRPALGHYGAAKAGIVALTMTAARELGPKGITDNVIAPGYIGTATLRRTLAEPELSKLVAQIPLGRLGEPAEVGRVVAFLASEAGSYLNGAIVDITGGRLEFAW